MGEYVECECKYFRWLDCDWCRQARVVCQMRVCIDCGAEEPGYEGVECPDPDLLDNEETV